MREKLVEQALVRAVLKRGGLCPKFVSSTAGWPDRMILMPGGRMAFAELKAPGGKPRLLQLYMHQQLRTLGFDVYVINSVDGINEVMQKLGEEPSGSGSSPKRTSIEVSELSACLPEARRYGDCEDANEI